MNVLFLVTQFPMLSETFILSQMTGLLDRGHDVRVVGTTRADPAGQGSGLRHGSIDRYGLMERSDALTTHAQPTRAERWAQLWRRPGLGIRSLAAWRYGYKSLNGNLLHLASGWPEFTGGYKPDVVLAHFGYQGDLAVCLRSLGLFAAPVATVVHGVDMSRPLSEGRPIYPRLRRAGDLMLPISQRWKGELLKAGFDAERVKVHHVGIRVPETLAPREPWAGTLRLLSVCRLVEKKGIGDALSAVKRLLDAGRDVRYTVVGDGPLDEALRAEASALGLGSAVEFRGALTTEQVEVAMNQHDVMLAPSATTADGDQEGIPTSMMEAMAAGLVVVSTFHSGIPELVTDGEEGHLVPEHDIAGLAEKVEALLAAPEAEVIRIREAAFEKVRTEFSIETLNDQLVQRLSMLASG
ncbi:MAG: glycosyltransferase [Planctomycetota bacterium]